MTTDTVRPPSPPQARVMQIAQGAMSAKLLAVITEAGVPDALAAGPRSAAEVAAACHLDADALSRALRALETIGMFSRQGDGRWSNTELGSTLVSDVPGSIRNYVVYALHDGNWRAWQQARLALTSGQPSFSAANDGLDFWTYLDAHPPVAAAFHRGMASMAAVAARALPPILAVDRFACVADIGGGNGLILSALLEAAPKTHGILYDTSAALAEAQVLLGARGLLDRVELVAGDFFEEVPRGADAYLLKNVLHDFADERCDQILERVRAAMPASGRLLIVDAVLPEGPMPHPAKWLDVHMLVAVGGRERTEPEWRGLLGRHGFALDRISQTPGPEAVIEARLA